ncbi:MAG: cell division ATP-binding protein FtsE [Halothece sp.]
MVQLQKVTKIYPNGSQGLSNVNLTLQRGEFVFITGASGAGKSTLLKLLYGQEKPTSGTVIVDGCDLGELSGDRLAKFRRRIGIVFQDYKLIQRRTVTENIAFILQAQGVPRKEINRRIPPTLKMVGLQHKAHCFPDQLSGGEQQRVSLARAIVGTPRLIIADEPTGNLDPENAQQVMTILQKLNSYGATVIVTTHDDRLVWMSNKSIAQLDQGRFSWIRG